MPEGEGDALRDAAAHRGLKLVKSRRRKEGVGDYGRYGLTDGNGKELLGFGLDGLTATPAEIRDYLRRSEVSTWAASAEVTPNRPEPIAAAKAEKEIAAADDNLPRRRTKAAATSTGRRRVQSASDSEVAVEPISSNRLPEPDPKPAHEQFAEPEPKPKTPSKPKAREKPRPKPEPEPNNVLEIRAAAKADLKAIARLVDQATGEVTLGRRFDELKRAGGGVLVAARGAVVACVSWHVVVNLHEPPIGRITLLIVEGDERHRGIGTALIAAAATSMADQGCTTVEAMSDIEVRNANGFFRAIGFNQKSYRFVADAERP